MKKEDYKGDYNKDLLEQYKLYVNMMDRISSRRYKSNYFYISLLSGMLAILSFVFGQNILLNDSILSYTLLFISILGICLCMTWFIHIGSYRQINDAKFEIIYEMEECLPYKCYKREWDKVKKKKYVKLTVIEQIIPLIFIVLYGILLYFSIINFL